MINFSMKDARWANMGIGLPMKSFGCYIVSLAMIMGITPDNILEKLMANDCFDNNGNLFNYKACEVLGFKTYQKLPPATEVVYPIIAETDHYAGLGYQKHFYIAMPDGTCVDPLDGLTKTNPYNVVSYREFA
jgi:hypothetical protein